MLTFGLFFILKCNYLVVSSHTEFELLTLVVLNIIGVTNCSLLGKTIYGNKVIHFQLSQPELFRAQTWYIDTS